MNTITRIWEGQRELSETPYFVGQIFIKYGRLKGSWHSATIAHANEQDAIFDLNDLLKSIYEK